MTTLEPVAVRLIEPDWVGRVPAPAHDGLTPTERRRLIDANPDSYLAVTRAPDDLDDGTGPTSPEGALAAGRASLERLLRAGAFSPLHRPRLHLYRLAVGGRRQTGIVAGVPVDAYDDGTIRIHEQIQTVRAEHLARHLEVVRAQSSPIALAHRPHPRVTEAVAHLTSSTEPTVDFVTDDGLAQQVWPVTEPEHERLLVEALADKTLYLIDGHHRVAAASMLRAGAGTVRAASMLCAVFPTDELHLDAFHRLLPGIDEAGLLHRLAAASLTVRAVPTPAALAARGPAELALIVGGALYAVGVPIDATVPADDIVNLDPVRLQQLILGPVLGIDDGQDGGRLRYRPGAGDADDLAALAAEGVTAFAMRPVSMAALTAASDAGRTMPSKSTNFQPKVRSGIFLRPLDADRP